MPNSSAFQPQTILRPNRPAPMWSAVTICLAAKTGLIIATWSVEKAVIRSVAASSPAAQVSVSYETPL